LRVEVLAFLLLLEVGLKHLLILRRQRRLLAEAAGLGAVPDADAAAASPLAFPVGIFLGLLRRGRARRTQRRRLYHRAKPKSRMPDRRRPFEYRARRAVGRRSLTSLLFRCLLEISEIGRRLTLAGRHQVAVGAPVVVFLADPVLVLVLAADRL